MSSVQPAQQTKMREAQMQLLIVQVHYRLSCVEFTMITTLLCANSEKNCNGRQKIACTFLANSYTAPLEKDFKMDANQDRNLRDRDQYLVKSSRPRHHQNSRDRDLKFETETSKFVHFAAIYLKISSSRRS